MVNIQSKYQNWASLLFDNYPAAYPTLTPQLKKDVFFCIHAWQKGSIGIFPKFGDTMLTALEYQLISVAVTLFPESLLNQEGVNRGRTMWLAWLSLYSMGLSEYLLASRRSSNHSNDRNSQKPRKSQAIASISKN